MNTKLVANHLLYLRKQNSFTQEDLAEKIGVSRQAVSNWERGETLPDVNMLLELSKLYGVSINQILEPGVISGKLDSFEDLHKVSEQEISYIKEVVSIETIVKACMGTAPENANWIQEHMQDVDFSEERAKIGRVRVSEVEEAQNEIVNLINLNIE